MSEQATEPRDARDADEIRIMDLATVFVRRWRIILGTFLTFLVMALALSVLQPRSYRAKTTFIPVQEGSGMRSNALLAQLPQGLLNLSDNSAVSQDQIAAILKSTSLADSMVNRLAAEYGQVGDEKQIRHLLDKRTSVRRGDGKSITVEIRGKNPGMVTRMADEFPEVVNSIVVHLGRQAATRKQAFLEEQLVTARSRLEDSEHRLLEFQQVRDAPELQEQARRTVEAAAELQRQVIEQEIRVAGLRRVATADNPELQAANAELNAWRAQLRRLTDNQSRDGQIFVTLKESPELQLSATRLLREYKKDEQIYVSMMAALAESQVEANRDLPVISVLDHPEPPKGPVGFHVGLILGLGAFLGLVLGLSGALAAEFADNARRDPKNAAFFAAWDQLKVDVRRYLPRRERRAAGSVVRG